MTFLVAKLAMVFSAFSGAGDEVEPDPKAEGETGIELKDGGISRDQLA